MADEIPIPFVDKTLDPSDPTGSGMLIVLLIAGMTVFAMTQSIGQNLASSVNQRLGSVLGVNPGTGQSQESDLV